MKTCFKLVISKLLIPDDVLIQFDLLKMSTVTLETFRDTK